MKTLVSVLILMAFATPAYAQGSGRAPSSGNVHWKGQAGLVFGGDDVGFVLGLGGEGRPFDSKQIEVNGDLNWMRLSGRNGLYVSGNGLYHFDTNDSTVEPFAGAGLGVAHFDGTEAFPQIVGGLDFKRTGRPMRLELRFLLPDGDTTTVLLLGFGFGR